MKFREDKSVIIKGKKKGKHDNEYNASRQVKSLEDQLQKSNSLNSLLMREIAKLKDKKAAKREILDRTLQQIKKGSDDFVSNPFLKGDILEKKPVRDAGNISDFFDKETSPVGTKKDAGVKDIQIEKLEVGELNQNLDALKQDNMELEQNLDVLKKRFLNSEKEKLKIRESSKRLEDDLRSVNLKLLELTETCQNMTVAHGDLEKFRLEFRQNMESATESETSQPNTPVAPGKNPFLTAKDSTETNPIGGLSTSNRMKLLNLENTTLSKRVDSLKKDVEMFRNEINLLRQSKGFDATENTRKIAVLENDLASLKKYNEDILIEIDQLRCQAAGTNGPQNLTQKELDQ